MAKIVGDSGNIAGGTGGALQTDFPTSVTNVFADPPKAAQVMEGDFVAGVITDSTDAQPGEGFDVFPFPAIADSGSVVVGGGDTVVMFKDSPAAQAFVKYLTTPEAAQIWAEKGGFASLNKNLDPSVYPDEITATTAGALAEAEAFRFDLSDLQPAEFGGTVGQGLFKLFQDFVQNPDDIDGITQQMEDAAATGVRELAEADERREHHGGAPGLGGSAGARTAGLARLRWSRWASSRPRSSSSGSGSIFPAIRTIIRSFFDDQGGQFDGFVWFDNYQKLFNDPNTVTAIKNNAIWVGVVPALVTAIGLLFAVMTERVSWSVAFKTVVFMPMAISLFAAGVIWRAAMYPQDPDVGAVNAFIGAVKGVFGDEGVLVEARPATDDITGSPAGGVRARRAAVAGRRPGASGPHRHPA